MTDPMFYIAGVDNQSDTQVELQNPASPSDNVKVPPNTSVPCDPPILVPNIMYNPPEEISVTTGMGVFYIRQWNGQLLSMLVNQGENVLAPPPAPGNFQLVVKPSGGIGVLAQ
jgi:hypothetical protein